MARLAQPLTATPALVGESRSTKTLAAQSDRQWHPACEVTTVSGGMTVVKYYAGLDNNNTAEVYPTIRALMEGVVDKLVWWNTATNTKVGDPFNW